jgi:predicted DNA-binding WGR domain protein
VYCFEFTSGKSAKQYTVSVVPKGRGFEVWAAWGRIDDTTPATARKSPKPLARADAEALAARLLDSKRRKGYRAAGPKSRRSAAQKSPPKRPGKLDSKPAPKATATAEWSTRFSQLATRKAIARLVETALMLEGARLDPKQPAEQFASTLVGFAPLARRFVPQEIPLDEKLVKATARGFKTLLAAEEPRRPKDDTGPAVAAMAVALLSRGVKSLDFFYAGGWDSVSMIDDGPEFDFSKRPAGGRAGATRLGAEITNWLLRQNAAFRINEIMYRLLEDSGAGPPEYSQHFSVDFRTGRLRKYGWARDRYE